MQNNWCIQVQKTCNQVQMTCNSLFWLSAARLCTLGYSWVNLEAIKPILRATHTHAAASVKQSHRSASSKLLFPFWKLGTLQARSSQTHFGRNPSGSLRWNPPAWWMQPRPNSFKYVPESLLPGRCRVGDTAALRGCPDSSETIRIKGCGGCWFDTAAPPVEAGGIDIDDAAGAVGTTAGVWGVLGGAAA